jgi:MarR family transcriptional regulator, organic hydroperoxide resistance regulator
MFELMHLSKRRFMAIASEFELSPPQVMALRQLDPDEPKPMSELALALRCDNSNVTGIVDVLEEKGLAAREPSPADRRVKLIALTADGRRLRTRLTRAIEKPPAWVEGLSVADQRALRDLLGRAAADGD